MSKADAILEYLDWLQEMCGYAAGTLALHQRIGVILGSKNEVDRVTGYHAR